MKKFKSGFGMIDLVLFIVIFGISSVAILRALQTILTVLPNAQRQTVATELAQGRMDIILGQYLHYGYSNFSDPCPAASVCQTLPGYTVSSTITTVAGPAKDITVTTSGQGSAILNMRVS